MKRHLTLAAAVAALLGTPALAQEDGVDAGQITGNVQLLFQTYQEDSLIGAQVPPSKTGFNAFGNLIYTRGDFSAGMRYESYLDPILGYPGRFRGSGVGYRYANYAKENFEVTLGNFYEQFGSGLLLRAYEERQLGIDNALDGFRLILRPTDGVTLKGLVGKQRLDFDSGLINGPGTIRAIDAEVNLNDAIANTHVQFSFYYPVHRDFIRYFFSGWKNLTSEFYFTYTERSTFARTAAPSKEKTNELPHSVQTKAAGHHWIANEVAIKKPEIWRNI